MFAVAYAQRQTMIREHFDCFRHKSHIYGHNCFESSEKKSLLSRCLLLSNARINFPFAANKLPNRLVKRDFPETFGDEKALTIVIN